MAKRGKLECLNKLENSTSSHACLIIPLQMHQSIILRSADYGFNNDIILLRYHFPIHTLKLDEV
jgi:hypothetical protein